MSIMTKPIISQTTSGRLRHPKNTPQTLFSCKTTAELMKWHGNSTKNCSITSQLKRIHRRMCVKKKLSMFLQSSASCRSQRSSNAVNFPSYRLLSPSQIYRGTAEHNPFILRLLSTFHCGIKNGLGWKGP